MPDNNKKLVIVGYAKDKEGEGLIGSKVRVFEYSVENYRSISILRSTSGEHIDFVLLNVEEHVVLEARPLTVMDRIFKW